MHTKLKRVQYPELFFGFVSPIGTDILPAIRSFENYFKSIGYKTVEIRITTMFPILKKYLDYSDPLLINTEFERYNSYIKFGNFLRKKFDDDSILSKLAILRIIRERSQLEKGFERTVYFIHQFKRKEEVDLFRTIYGRLFFQISLYSRRGARVDYLARKFARSMNTSGPQKFRDRAESVIQIDENEAGETHGQRVGKVFHEADFVVSLEAPESVNDQIFRFCELIFSSNAISPNKLEYGMFLAKAAALRTLDLSRQVGAAIFSNTGEIISLGSNEVPKAGGGTYWCDDPFDDREFIRGVDSNDQRKKEILLELLDKIPEIKDKLESVINRREIIDSQFMDALEYGRIVHAEMSALSDAARLGRSTRESRLFSTTFPCHMCAKHIIAAGVSEVIFLEPYPKSLAFDLHSDSLEIEGGDRGRYDRYPSVSFKHFYGITPRRYRELFERGQRKKNGSFIEYSDGERECRIDIKYPLYETLETVILELADRLIPQYAKFNDPHTSKDKPNSGHSPS